MSSKASRTIVGRKLLKAGAASRTVEELELLPIQDRQVLVRTEASAPCYTLALNGIGGTPSLPGQPGAFGPAPGGPPTILNHTFVGIVEAAGPGVRRVQTGDRVIVGVTSQCGQCYACLHGRADACQFNFGVTGGFPPIAKRPDGTPVGAQLGIGGFSDPTGILPMQQAWQSTRRGGSLMYLGFGQAGNVSYPASQFANNGRTVFSGQQGGLNMMRDLPGFVHLIERGQLDLKTLVTSTWPPERTREALQVLSDRTEMCPVVVFS